MNPRKVLYVGNILPEGVAKTLQACVAGNNFELSFVKALDETLGGKVDVISISWQGYPEIRNGKISEVFAGKKFKHVVQINKPIVHDVVRDIHFFYLALKWCLKNARNEKVILILNSPFGICFFSLLTKVLGTKVVSFTIDTPFTPSNKFKGILGQYSKMLFSLGHYSLRFFSGIVVLNRAAVVKLKLEIPYLIAKIGYDAKRYNSNGCNGSGQILDFTSDRPKQIVYAGTLIDYNGVLTLAEAVKLLGKERCVLHIYGSGPLESEVVEVARQSSNIVFHGMIDHEDMLRKLSESDVLVNPRVTSASVCDFTFPSKLTEYLLSGRPVVTTRFSSLPKDYEEFVFLVEDETPEGFCRAIRKVFDEDERNLARRCRDGAEYIRRNQSWSKICEEVRDFLASLWPKASHDNEYS